MFFKPLKMVAFTSMMIVMSRMMVSYDTSAQYHTHPTQIMPYNQKCTNEYISNFILELFKSIRGINNTEKSAFSFMKTTEILEIVKNYVKSYKSNIDFLKVENFHKIFEELKLQLKDFETSKDSSFALKNPEFLFVFDLIKNHSNTIKSIAEPLVELSISHDVLKSIPECTNISIPDAHSIFTLIFMKNLRNYNMFLPSYHFIEKSDIDEYNKILNEIFNIYERKMGFTEMEQRIANELFVNPSIMHFYHITNFKNTVLFLSRYDNRVIGHFLKAILSKNLRMDLSVNN